MIAHIPPKADADRIHQQGECATPFIHAQRYADGWNACVEMLEAFYAPAVSELIDAATAYAATEEDLANREINGINAEPYERLQARVHAARRDLDAALARVGGAK